MTNCLPLSDCFTLKFSWCATTLAQHQQGQIQDQANLEQAFLHA